MPGKKKKTARRKTKKRTVKKARRKVTRRRRNPARSVRKQVAQAADLFQRFSGEAPRYLDTVTMPAGAKVLMSIGPCDGVLYSARRDGKVNEYVHEFSGKSRPLLCASADGTQLYLIGGKYDFTEDGIVDRK